MTYRVLYTHSVRSDIADQVKYLQDQKVSPEMIEDWFAKLFDLIDALYECPLRHPIAETETKEMGFEVRKLIYADYLVFYRVDEGQGIVEVLSFQHGARRSRA